MFKKIFKFAKRPISTTVSTVINPHKTTKAVSIFISGFLVKFLCCAFLLIGVLLFFRDAILKIKPSFKKTILVAIYSDKKQLNKEMFKDFESNTYKINYTFTDNLDKFKTLSEKSSVSILLGKDFDVFEKNNILFPINKNYLSLKHMSQDLVFNGIFGNYVSLCKIPIEGMSDVSLDKKSHPLNSILIGQSMQLKEADFNVVVSYISIYCKNNNYL